MEAKMSDTLDYVVFLTRHISRGNVKKAILVILMELGFLAELDGFDYLRKAILIRTENSELRVNNLYRAVARLYEERRGIRQIESAVEYAIGRAWEIRIVEKWRYFFSGNENWGEYCPANGVFISTMGCVMELWVDCEREVSHAGK